MSTTRHGFRKRQGLREASFRISVVLKGLNAALEVVGGIALLAVSPAIILQFVSLLTPDEAGTDPRDQVASYLRRAAAQLSVGGKRFAAIYLLSHGLIKLLMVWALLERKLWAYPLSILVFGAFIVYQLYRFTFTHGWGLIALSVFDVVVIALIHAEYRALKRGGAGA